MPIYNFRNMNTGEITEELMSIAAREDYLINNPQLKAVQLSAPPIVSGRGDAHTKMNSHDKDVFNAIADANPNSPMRDKWGSDRGVTKSAERAAVKKAADKVVKREEVKRAAGAKFVQS